MTTMARKPQSLESVLDEERRHVLALLEEARIGSSPENLRSENGTQTPLQPVRSMLQFDMPLPYLVSPTIASSSGENAHLKSSVRSMLDINPIGSPIKNISSLPDLNSSKYFTTSYRSMLDVSPSIKSPSLSIDNGYSSSPRVSPARGMLDVSPTKQSYLLSPTFNRSTSPQSVSSRNTFDFSPTAIFSTSSERSYKSHPPLGSLSHKTSVIAGHKYNSHLQTGNLSITDPESTNYLSGYLPSDTSGSLVANRKSQTGKAASITNDTVDAVRSDLFSFKDSSRYGSSQKSRTKSRSPHNRFLLRNRASKNPDSAKNLLNNDEKAIAPKRMQRRRSDANLTRTSGVLLSLPIPRRRTYSGAAALPSETRIRNEAASRNSGDTVATYSDNSESDDDMVRGRKLDSGIDSEREIRGDPPEQRKKSRISRSPESVVEEENRDASKELQQEENGIESDYTPAVIVTEPSDTLPTINKPNDSPKLSSDEGDSGSNASLDSETEAGMSDIKSAQNLPINITACISTPATSRCVRSIHRGDFIKLQQEAREDKRRVRKYLVAIDLSEEAAHALEWTIGTVLRDGDTLLAIYCVDEEVGIYTNDNNPDDKLQEQRIANFNSNFTPNNSSSFSELVKPQNHYVSSSRKGSASESSDRSLEKSSAEQQRCKAVQEITDRVSKFLRRTKLQVKVVIEVIHCKSPKHLITEVIDFVSPTLVILGSRGRSALKGFILGSFSNYIVSKSSVPVMVARKRLRKSSKYKRPSVRLANNIENPHQMIDSRILAAARIE